MDRRVFRIAFPCVIGSMMVILMITGIGIIGCGSKQEIKEQRIVNRDTVYAPSKVMLIDTCSICDLESCVVDSFKGQTKNNLVIDYPVVIKFWGRAKLILAAHEGGRVNFELLKTAMNIDKHNYGLVYSYTEQYHYYNADIEPVLVKNGVKILDPKYNRFIRLKDRDKEYVIDLDIFRNADNDGVFLFVPGKKPVFWTMVMDEKHCHGQYGIFPYAYLWCSASVAQ